MLDLLGQEFGPSPGHLTALLSTCVFAPSLLTFWFVNGVLDFSTAAVLGTLGGPGGLLVRLVAYLLLVPAFVLLRAGFYLLHPTHRRTVLSGSCPRSDLLSLDWFSVGILATGLPLSLQSLGPWLGANAVVLLGVFVVPRFLSDDRTALAVKLAAIGGGAGLFAYASYGAVLAARLPAVPAPTAVLGPVATLRLSDATTASLLDATNSLLVGPVLVAVFALAVNRLLTRPEVTSVPLLRLSLPHRDPARVVLASAALGTVFYLLVVALWTGHLRLVP
jgi:hypothetical protein